QQVGIRDGEALEPSGSSRHGCDAVFQAWRELTRVVVHPHPLKHHRELALEKRILRRGEIAKTAGERPDLVEAVAFRVAEDPVVRRAVLRRTGERDVVTVPELAAEPLRKRPRDPTRLLGQEPELHDSTGLWV